MRKTHEQFVNEIAKISPNIKIIGRYQKAVERIEVECKQCGKVWSTLAYSLSEGKGCPHCSAKQGAKNNKGKTGLKTHEQLNEPTEVDNSESTIYGENFEDCIFISDEAYMEVYARLGEENAQQLRVFAENFERWLPEEGAMAGGTLGIAVYDLDKDGQLELMCTLV